MKLYDVCTTVIIIFICIVVGITSSKWLGDDNEIEELSEEIIQLKTGLEVDLTPASKE